MFTKELLRQALAEALKKIEENFDYLNELDSATGDGDHGTAILTSMKAAVEAAAADASLSQMLQNIGWGIMNATGGSTSSLTGSLFLGMGDAAEKDTADVTAMAKMLASGLDSVQMMTQAKVGDKTLMDALIPASHTASQVLASNPKATIGQLLAAAADAAKQGAESTKDLVAKFGRAKNLGERSKGHQDAGATSIALILQAFADTVKD